MQILGGTVLADSAAHFGAGTLGVSNASLTINSGNNLTGVNISSGTVLTNAAGALGTGGLTVGSGATLTVNGSNGLTGAVQINGATVLANSAAL